jgi:hypothetical protein
MDSIQLFELVFSLSVSLDQLEAIPVPPTDNANGSKENVGMEV